MKKPKSIKKRTNKRSFKKFKSFWRCLKKTVADKPSRVSKYNLEELCRQHQEMIDAGFFDELEFVKQSKEWLNLKPVGREIF